MPMSKIFTTSSIVDSIIVPQPRIETIIKLRMLARTFRYEPSLENRRFDSSPLAGEAV